MGPAFERMPGPLSFDETIIMRRRENPLDR